MAPCLHGYGEDCPLLLDADREHFLVVCLDTKNKVNSITTCHIGTLNASVVHPSRSLQDGCLGFTKR
ncbi:JAB domain-containing protein [Paenibacillus sp. CAA11]|uniref:JAB domain-containing protein n=1 Tax=Paenibacillus sp. CAA11 TaxID=1532905 RepID=UPI003FA3469D